MKLMTEISGNDDDVILVYNGDIDVSGEDQAEHDAAAAHALLQAMDVIMPEVEIHEITGLADELMREWGFEPEAGK